MTWYKRALGPGVVLRCFLPQGLFPVHGKGQIDQSLAGHLQKAESSSLEACNRYQPVGIAAGAVVRLLGG